MSWFVSVTDADPATAEAALATAYDEYKTRIVSTDPETDAGTDEQFAAAVAAAVAVVSGGVVGEGNVNLSLSGHANPGHKPRSGYANDAVTVAVTSAARGG
jgi:hypothetical protein